MKNVVILVSETTVQINHGKITIYRNNEIKLVNKDDLVIIPTVNPLVKYI